MIRKKLEPNYSMPKLAAFPKAFMDPLCVDGSLSLADWLKMAANLEVDGTELYSGMLDLKERSGWSRAREQAEALGLTIPMLCCSPDFTHPDAEFRSQQIEYELSWIEMSHELGASYCRVLSGQRRPEVSREAGIQYVVECIEACLPAAERAGVTLILENHFKDNYWDYPEFAQHMDVFCDLIARLDSPFFGVNYDPSNAVMAGEDAIELLERVKQRVVTMHASDRYLLEGTLEELQGESFEVYAARLSHGEIGKGLNDYDAIFEILRDVGFDGWISIEDGVDGLDQLARSADFLRGKIGEYWE